MPRSHPSRTYVAVPFQRALTIWFTLHYRNFYPSTGNSGRSAISCERLNAAFITTAGFAVLGYVYVALALGGIWIAWRVRESAPGKPNLNELPNLWGVALLVAYPIVRTAFLTTVEAPEPRYVVSCYPALLALAAQLFACAPVRKRD